MTSQELQTLINTSELKKLSFDGGYFNLEFDNGVSVEVGITTEYDCPVWDIESNIEIEQRRLLSEKRSAENKEAKRLLEEKQREILSKFPEDQWDEIRKTFIH